MGKLILVSWNVEKQSVTCLRLEKHDKREINSKCIELIKSFEGWRSKAYKDAVGKWTVGYGHLIKPGDNLNESSCITEEEGNKLLNSDVRVLTLQNA